MVCPSCGTDAPASARFCPGCGHALDPGRGDERRLVTVLFADLVGYTTLAESRDPEQVKNLVDRCFERLAADVVGHGGRVDKIVGDAIMALFGAPQAHEDDAERAVRAGLQMQRTIDSFAHEMGVDMKMRVGVNSGEVLVGALRAGGDYTAMGDVVNTASRLQSIAEPGQVLVGPAAHAATRDVLRYRSLGLVRARGREEPVPAWVAVEAVVPPGHRPRRVRTPLVGRDPELGLLRHALAVAAERRRAQLVLLSGDAGTGKTRLAEELALLARAERHAYVLEGRCVPYGESNVWWPLAEALRRASGILPDEEQATSKQKGHDAVAALLGPNADPAEYERVMRGFTYLIWQTGLEDVEPARAREEALRSLLVCIEHVTADRPLVFVVAELHWADDLLLDFLDRLLDRVAHLPVLIVATARPELSERWHPPAGLHNHVVLHLDPLDANATAALLRELLDREPEERLRDALVERSGGNPLFLEELVALMASDESVAELPLTLRGLVAARLDALSPVQRSTLEDAAVVGRTGTVDALVAMANREATVELALAALVGADLLACPDGGPMWEFRSELVREVAYGTLTKAERARRHAVLAAWLEATIGDPPTSEELDELAHHYGTAAELQLELGRGLAAEIGPRALAWLERAAARAHAEELWPAAEGLLDQALGLASFGDATTVLRLVLARARARVELRRLEEARADLNQATALAEEAGDRVAQVRALIVCGHAERVEGDLDRSAKTFRDAVAKGRDVGDDHLVADALRGLGQALLFGGDIAGADAASAEALDVYRALGDRRGEAWALQSLALTGFLRGDFGPAEARVHASAAAFKELGDWGGYGWAMGILAWIRHNQGRLDEAERIADALLRDEGRTGDPWALGMMEVLLASVDLWTGRTRLAVERAAKARARFVEMADPWAELQAVGPLGRGLLALGEIDAGRATLDELPAVAARVRDPAMHRLAVGTVALARAQQLGDGEAALALAQPLLDHASELSVHDGMVQHGALGIILLQAERLDEALVFLEGAMGSEADEPHSNTMAMLSLALVMAGRLDQAEALFARTRGAGTYLDQAWSAIARAFAAVRQAQPGPALGEVDEAVALVDATEDRLAQALMRVARASVLDAVGAPDATATDDLEERLEAIGVAFPGWAAAFRVAVGAAEAPGRAAVAAGPGAAP